MIKTTRGLALVEIVVVVAIIGITISSLYSLLVLSRATLSRHLRATQALALAQEGLEAVRNIRDQDWSNNIEPLGSGANYYLTLSGSSWALTTTNPGPIDSLFTRTVVFASVNRDESDNISDSGETDPNTRKITATVAWTERGSSRSVSLTTYITNFLDT